MDIGDFCNAKLGSPERKCRALFAEARADCSDLLGDFNFLCDIIDGFLKLCELARGAFTDTMTVRALLSFPCDPPLGSFCSRRALLPHPFLHRRTSEETSGRS